MTPETWLAWVLASAAFAVVPGPTVTVILANALRYGTRAGLMNVAGAASGRFIWLLAAALGLSAMIAVMGAWFELVRLAGAAYLVGLGIRLLRANGDLAVAAERARPGGSFFLQGVVVILSNPKVLVLFGAIIPLFLPKSGNAILWTFALGLVYMAIVTVTDATYAVAAGRAGSWLKRSRIRALELVSGCFLTAGGIWLALKGR